MLKLTVVAGAFAGFLAASPVLSQGVLVETIPVEANTMATVEVIEQESAVQAEAAVQADVEGDTSAVAPTPAASPTRPPGGLGLFFFGLRERLSILTTVNPIKKAEKQAAFAEERLKIAERILGSNPNEEAKNKANEVIKRAENLLSAAEKREEFLKNNPDAASSAALRNIANSQVRVGQVLDRIETRLPESARETFQIRRESVEDKSRGLIRAIQNDNMPEEVKEHLKEVQASIELRAEAAKEFRIEREEILRKAQAGDEAAKNDLKELYAERKATLQEVREEYLEARESLKEAAKNGNATAEKTLKALNRVEGIQGEVRDTMREKQDERREEVKVRLESEVKAGNVEAEKKLEVMQKVDDRLDARDVRLDERREEVKQVRPLRVKPVEVKKESSLPAVRAIQRAKQLPPIAEERKAGVEAEL